MEPQQFSCGNPPCWQGQVPRGPSTSIEPQHGSCGNDRSHRNNDLQDNGASMGPQQFSCGNVGVLADNVLAKHASIEPQKVNCGNIQSSRWLRVAHSCFNGATTIQLWKRQIHRESRHNQGERFNGATTVQLWKLGKAPLPVMLLIGLQWSHNSSVVETAGENKEARANKALQWSHNSSVVETSTRCILLSRVSMASMEPQQFSCGNGSAWLALMYPTGVLQWSHNSSVVETRGTPTGYLYKTRASMEPQQFSCGNARPM